MKSYRDRFWDNLELTMKTKNRSWRSLAKDIGVADTQLFQAKSHRYVPRPERILKMADSLSVKPSELIDV